VTGATGFGISGANRITIEGFAIEPAGEGTGIEAVSTQGSKFASNIIDATGYGIELEAYDSDVLVTGNTLKGNNAAGSTGIFDNGDPDDQICDNRVTDYVFGIFYPSDDSDSTGGVVLDNTVDSNGIGIDSQGAAIEGNVANQNGLGIDAQTAGAQVVTGNTANGNTGVGIVAVAADGGALTVEHNTANDNSAEGILADGNGQASILGNTANGNKQQGIVIGSGAAPTSATIIGNTAVSNGGDGIDIEAADLTFSGNIANDNAGDGFNFNSGTTVSIVGNTADNNSESGFVILASAGTVSNNTADFNKGTTSPEGGFVIAGSFTPSNTADITVTGNVAVKNAGGGFDLLLDTSTVSGNTAIGNGGPGFTLLLVGNTVSRNTAVDNGSDGFTIYSGNSSISGNTADANDADGIDLYDVGGSTITGNTADSNRQVGIDVSNYSLLNSISKNTALKNGTYDLQDESTGSGTAGTANTWSDNTAKTSNPSGLL
jgi:parallel beta-helix repeat protein